LIFQPGQCLRPIVGHEDQLVQRHREKPVVVHPLQLNHQPVVEAGGVQQHHRLVVQPVLAYDGEFRHDRAPVGALRGLDPAGLQAVVELPPGTEGSVLRAAAARGLALNGIAQFRHVAAGAARQLPDRDALVVGYATPSDSAWAGALDALCSVLP
jgi:hypothetical protein